MKPSNLISRLAAGIAVLASASPVLADAAALPLPEIYRATLPCLVQVFQVPTDDDHRDPFKTLFGSKSAPQPKAGAGGARETQRPVPNGLGMIWGDGSLVLTPEFLVPSGKDEASREFVLEAADGRRLEARLQALDRSSGIALLKAEVPLAPACRFGDSAGLEVGQAVVAIGNMQRLRLLMSPGIVSGLATPDPSNPDGAELAILTTTASAPGMAGGPLLDLQGRVIGMHQAMMTGNSRAAEVAIAMPIQRVLAAAQELALHGKRVRSRLGVQAYDELLPLGKAALLETRRVPIVHSVLAGSPAERAGLRENDRLIAIDAVPLADTADLRRRVNATQPGTPLRIEVERDGARRTLSATTDVAGSE